MKITHITTLRTKSNTGMSLPEAVISIALMAAFSAIYIASSQLTVSFFKPMSKPADSPPYDHLNDYNNLLVTMDKIIEVISQPAYTKEEVINFECTNTPFISWDLPGSGLPKVPNSYNICIKPVSSMLESDSSYLYSELPGSQPGIYVLYAIPLKGLSLETLPVRRIFCRPRPYC